VQSAGEGEDVLARCGGKFSKRILKGRHRRQVPQLEIRAPGSLPWEVERPGRHSRRAAPQRGDVEGGTPQTPLAGWTEGWWCFERRGGIPARANGTSTAWWGSARRAGLGMRNPRQNSLTWLSDTPKTSGINGSASMGGGRSRIFAGKRGRAQEGAVRFVGTCIYKLRGAAPTGRKPRKSKREL